MSSTTKILIWVGLVAAIFAFAWWKGYLLRLSNYVQQTREELRKCTWPTWDELKGSTVLIAVGTAILGAFTVVIDRVFFYLFWVLKI